MFKAKLDDSNMQAPSSVKAAALALYDAVNPVVMAKFESGEFTTEEEANAFGNKITAAVASACEDAGEDDFPEVFKAKLRECDMCGDFLDEAKEQAGQYRCVGRRGIGHRSRCTNLGRRNSYWARRRVWAGPGRARELLRESY